MDGEMPQTKTVAETKSVQVLRDGPEVFEVVVNRDRQLGFELTEHPFIWTRSTAASFAL
jgi:hypothetical protein